MATARAQECWYGRLAWTVLACAAAVLVCAPRPVRAQSSEPGKNVILIFLDDVGIREVPSYYTPIHWPESSLDDPTSAQDDLAEALTRSLTLNRFEARSFANVDGSLGTPEGNDRLVVPVDVADGGTDFNTANTFRYQVGAGSDCTNINRDLFTDDGNCTLQRDVLTGFGGLGRLAREGVVFTRFYATAGLCGPTRSAIFTGRHAEQVGTSGNGRKLDTAQVTIADWLKYGCDDSNPLTACYKTGHIGKWHQGVSLKRAQQPWQRGYDETFFYKAHARAETESTDFTCSPPPVPSKELSTSDMQGFFCLEKSDPDAQHQCSSCPGRTANDNNSPATTSDCVFDSNLSFCYAKHPRVCIPPATEGCDCQPWGLYLGEDSREACHPDDIDNAQCCARSKGRTTAHGKTTAKPGRYEVDTDAPGVWHKDGERYPTLEDPEVDAKYPCNNDGETFRGPKNVFGTQCRYSTRIFRDAAANFILRHRNDRFFLSIALTSLHHERQPTQRARAHYHTSSQSGRYSRAGEDTEKYWGQFEETDAAIGRLLSLINEGFCVGAGDYAFLGGPCGPGDACPTDFGGHTGTCFKSLKDDTVVLFTADQGSDVQGYGMPNVRDQKESTYEGGVRIPFMAWSGNNYFHGNQEGNQSHAHEIDTRFLGSQVDIFATIANMAGFTPDAYGHIPIWVRQNEGLGRTLCEDNPNDPNDGCVERQLAGRTLLPVLRGSGTTDTNKMRDMAYAVQAKKPEVLTTRTGYFCDANGDGTLDAADDVENCPYAAKMCSYDKVQSADASIDRHVWGASGASSVSTPRCQACTTNDDCGLCYVQGVCVPDNVLDPEYQHCTDDTAQDVLNDCRPVLDRRCMDDEGCPSDHLCRIVDVGCDECRPATWKLLATGGIGALYDLTGNPEERDRDDRYDDEPPNPRDPAEVAKLTVFNCASNVDDPPSDPDVQKVVNVQKCLKCMVDNWLDCTKRSDHGDGLDCEDPRLWQSDPAHGISPHCVNECPSY